MHDPSTIHALITSRPDERRMVSWECDQIDRRLLQGYTFHCPCLRKVITVNTPYDLDPIFLNETEYLHALLQKLVEEAREVAEVTASSSSGRSRGLVHF